MAYARYREWRAAARQRASGVRDVVSWFRAVLLRAKARRWAARRGMVAVPLDELDRLCGDAAVLLVAEVEAELIRVSGQCS